jgi:transposase-like protein
MRYKASLRDLTEMVLDRGVVFTQEAVREWETKLAPVAGTAVGVMGEKSNGLGPWTSLERAL